MKNPINDTPRVDEMKTQRSSDFDKGRKKLTLLPFKKFPYEERNRKDEMAFDDLPFSGFRVTRTKK